MVTRRGDHFYMVVNGATKHGDIAHLRDELPRDVVARPYEGAGAARAAGAQGGRGARAARARASRELSFMTGGAFRSAGISRLDQPLGLYRRGRLRDLGRRGRPPRRSPTLLVAEPEVKPIGLGARDSLRLEAGLPLYGHDLDRDDDAGRGRPRLRALQAPARRGRLPGRRAHRSPSSSSGAVRKRVGLLVEGRQPVREGALVVDGEGNEVGKVTSGGFSPSLEAADRHGLCAGRLGRARHRAHARAARQDLPRRRSRRCPSSPTATTAREPPDEPSISPRSMSGSGSRATPRTVGITDFAQGQLGDIVFVEVPEAGRQVDQGRRGRGGRIGQGRVGRLCAGRRRGDRGQRGAGRRARRWSTAIPKARAGSSSCGSPIRASSTA